MLTLVDSLTFVGGGERFAAQVATSLDPARFESIVCATRVVSESGARAAAEKGVRVVALERTSRLSPAAWLRLVRLLRLERVDVLHAHKFGSNVWGTVLGRLAGVPVVVAHEQTWSYDGEPLRRFLDRHVVARLADVFVAVSHEDARRMVSVEGIDPSLVRVVPNAIPAPRPGSPERLRSHLGIPDDAPVVGVVGLLRAQKALEVLVDAAALMRDRVPGLRVLIAGDGPERARLEALVRARGLESVVSLLGVRSDVPDVLAALDVAVLTSDFEGTPLAVLEYMAAGKAIVATRVGGVPELLDEGEHGLLVPPRDPAALAEAVELLLADPVRRHALGRAARERQRREFDLNATVRGLEALYEELLRSAPARRRAAAGRRKLSYRQSPTD